MKSWLNVGMTLGERLKIARAHAGITQLELSERSGASQQAISSIERGDADGSTQLVQIAVACSVRPEWLAMELGPMLQTEIPVTDQKLIHLLKIAELLPDFGKDKAIKELSDLVEFIKAAQAAQKP